MYRSSGVIAMQETRRYMSPCSTAVQERVRRSQILGALGIESFPHDMDTTRMPLRPATAVNLSSASLCSTAVHARDATSQTFSIRSSADTKASSPGSTARPTISLVCAVHEAVQLQDSRSHTMRVPPCLLPDTALR
eukprot:CAMPEP_0202908786 /NCGR_PEP_ID=MMETSP1392-20130828/47236_1 /ASSEMBLY_ACC=CAM_ASM_000868 /TAXON_ID=225041 /ORGANISM="Chlamydomonas chlamydogama, Strain SAG 11-48b" /LENGTH=135 /DNA_ID=CAMNT_0049598285 /DNA_START=48 /DNA_END=452 /DNA_ORIENTATION=+